MASPLLGLRLGNIFDPSQMGQTADPNADPTSLQPQQINPNVAAMMAQLYQPDMSAQTNLQQLMTKEPQAPNPNWIQKLLGGGLAAIKDQSNLRNAKWANPTETGQQAYENFIGMPKYQTDLANWKAQLQPAESAANLEKSENANQRTAAFEAISDRLKQQTESEKERHDMATEKAAMARQQIQQFAANNKDWQFTAPKGGNYTFINKLTGEKRDTGVATGTLNQMDEMNLGANNAMARTEVTAGSKGQLGEIPDPNDSTGQKKISVWITTDAQGNPVVKPITMGGQQVNPNKTSSAAPVDNAAQAKQTQEIQDKTRDALSVIDELMGNDNKLKNTAGLGLTGLATRHIPGTQGYNNVVAINRLKGILTLDLIGQIRAASRSGATGFGRITNQELTLLSNSAAQLDPGQSPEKFEEQLNIIKQKLNKMLLPDSGTNPTVTKPAGTQTAPPAPAGWKYVPKPGGGWTAIRDTSGGGGSQ